MKYSFQFSARPGHSATSFAIRCISILLPFLITLSPIGSARATVVERLFEVEVPVSDQSAEQRNAAINEAFRKLLVRVTGNRNVLNRSELADELRHGAPYVQQYRYRLLSTDATPNSENRRLRVVFDSTAVQRLLRSKGVTVWGVNRPALLLWLGIQQGGNRRFYQADEDNEIRERMGSLARNRGIPLLHPLLDLEDQSTLQISDLWGDFQTSIRQASQRYGPDAILTARLVDRGGLWRGRWTLYRNNTETWESSAKTGAEAVTRGLDHAIDLLAENYVLVGNTGGGGRFLVRVEELADLEAFGRVSTFLSGLDAVEQVSLVAAEPTASTFGVSVQGGEQVLERNITLGGLLQRLPDIPVEMEQLSGPESTRISSDQPRERMLQYRLRP